MLSSCQHNIEIIATDPIAMTHCHIFLSSVSVIEWPPFGKKLLTWLTIFLLFVILAISRFGFEGWSWVLIASVPDLCILFTSIVRSQVSYTLSHFVYCQQWS